MSFITSGVAVFSSTFPPPVTGFIASNPTETTVDLVWNRSPAATLYSIETSPPSGTMTTTDTFITFMELTPDTEYTFIITPSNANGSGSSTTSNPISTLLPLPGFGPATGYSDPPNPTETTMDLAWFEYVPEYATSFNVYAYSVLDGLIGFENVPISSFSYTYTGLTPNTEYYFTVAGVNATGVGEAGGASASAYTLLPLPGDGNMNYPATNVTATSMDVSWQPADYASSYNLYVDGPDGRTGPISVIGTTYTFTGLTPDTAYSFSVTPVNATGNGVPGPATPYENTLIQTNLTYTGTIETLALRSGNYRFQMAGGSGPLRSQVAGGAGRCFAEYTFDYTVTSTITIQYAIGQASPGDVGGAGGTYMYDLTNSQWLFIAGGAGTDNFSPNPSENVPGDGSGGAAGSGGGSGAGVISNGSDSTVSAGSGGLTVGNGGTGGAAGTFGDSPQPGGFGGGGGGTRVYDPALPPLYGEYAYYPGGGGGYTGGTTDTTYTPEVFTTWFSGYGTSYMIPGSTFWGYNTNQGSAPVTNGYININPS